MKVPCKDCLIFPVCNNGSKDMKGYIFIHRLTVKCSIIDEFIDKDDASFKDKLAALKEFYQIGEAKIGAMKWKKIVGIIP